MIKTTTCAHCGDTSVFLYRTTSEPISDVFCCIYCENYTITHIDICALCGDEHTSNDRYCATCNKQLTD